MHKFIFLPALMLALVLTPLSLASADDEAVYARLTQQKADSIVSVKLVLAVKMSGAGGSREQEVNTSSTGVIIDAAGLILLPDSAFDAASMMGIPRRFRRQINITSAPISIRVTFPGDTKEYDAVLGAKDSKLGLGFVLIKDLAGKVIKPVDLSTIVEPKLGQKLYGVTRLDQGFDHAPMCTATKIAGRVTKPRAMWIVQGGAQHLAQPLYDATGAVTGIVVQQEGVGEDAESRPFLLPMKVATATFSGALKKSKTELDRILEEEEEAAEEEADADEQESGDADSKDDPKKDQDGDEKKTDEKKTEEKKDDGGSK